MSIVNPVIAPVATKVKASAKAHVLHVTDDLGEYTPRPMDLSSFVPEDGMIVNGFMTVPKIWVRGRGAATTDGSFIDSARLAPTELNVDCHSRFIASSDFYDDVAGIWRPFYTRGVDWYWTTDPSNKPTLMNLEYQISRELLTFDVLNFTGTDYLRSAFNNDMDDAAEYTVVMVASFDSPTGYNGLSTPQRNFVVHEKFAIEDINVARITTVQHPAQIDPAIVIISVRPPMTRVYVVSPDGKIGMGSVQSAPVSQDMIFQIGKRLTGSDGPEVSMKLMEWSLLDYAVDSKGGTGLYNLNQLISLYSSVYGAR